MQKMLKRKVDMIAVGLLSLVFVLCSPISAAASVCKNEPIEAVVVYENDELIRAVETEPKIMTSASFSTSWRSSGFYVRNGSVEVAIDSGCSINGSFTVDLLRNASVVGTAQFKRNGYTKVSWKNVPTGSYGLRLSKSNDGSIVRCQTIRISV